LSNKKNTCGYCGGGIYFQEDPKKPRKPDGMMAWSCYNLDMNTKHDCPQAPWRKSHFSEAKMWKAAYKLPVYCYSCNCYYLQDKLCSHLEDMMFRPGIDLPGNFEVKFISAQKKKKNSNTLYNRDKSQEKIL